MSSTLTRGAPADQHFHSSHLLDGLCHLPGRGGRIGGSRHGSADDEQVGTGRDGLVRRTRPTLVFAVDGLEADAGNHGEQPGRAGAHRGEVADRADDADEPGLLRVTGAFFDERRRRELARQRRDGETDRRCARDRCAAPSARPSAAASSIAGPPVACTVV